MKKLLFIFLLPLVCAASEYEFLTPYAVVVKGNTSNPSGVISTSYRSPWKKENALQRDNTGKILRKPDITSFQYFVLEKPFVPGEIRSAK